MISIIIMQSSLSFQLCDLLKNSSNTASISTSSPKSGPSRVRAKADAGPIAAGVEGLLPHAVILNGVIPALPPGQEQAGEEAPRVSSPSSFPRSPRAESRALVFLLPSSGSFSSFAEMARLPLPPETGNHAAHRAVVIRFYVQNGSQEAIPSAPVFCSEYLILLSNAG